MDRNTSLGAFWQAMALGQMGDLSSLINEPIGSVRHLWFRDRIGPEITEMIRAIRRDNPDFAHGGIVPGAIGAPITATLHGGERVLTPAQQGGGNNFYISISAIDGASVKAIVPDIAAELDKHLKGTGAIGLLT